MHHGKQLVCAPHLITLRSRGFHQCDPESREEPWWLFLNQYTVSLFPHMLALQHHSPKQNDCDVAEDLVRWMTYRKRKIHQNDLHRVRG